MNQKLMTIEPTHRNAATLELMPQYTRMDLRNDDGSFILFWNVSTIQFLDEMESEIARMQAMRTGRAQS